MRLAALLAELPPDELERLAGEHLGNEEFSRSSLCSTLEGVLRSYSFVRKFVADRMPPTFSILETLLDADGWSAPAATFRDVVTEHSGGLIERVANGDLVSRDDGLRLYRRVLVEARRNDLVLDGGETAILGVLRRELDIRTVEHFLLEHHADFHEFWSTEHAFLDAMTSLRSCGLIFGHEGTIVLADEVVPLVRQTLGFEMPTSSRIRLFGRLSSSELSDVLSKCGLKSSGTTKDKVGRLAAAYVQPSEVLRALSLQSLRDLCRDLATITSGSKDELVERLVAHFLHSLDLHPASVAPPPPEPEPRTLNELAFRELFGSLRGEDLADILAAIESSRITGAKETKVTLLLASPFCESTLLEKLTNSALEDALWRHRLRTTGSKREKAERLMEHFRDGVGSPVLPPES